MDPEIKELFDRFTHTQEFLRVSIESHDRQLGELTEKIDRISDRMDETNKRLDRFIERTDRFIERTDRFVERMDRFVETTDLNFQRLTTAMMGLTDHIADQKKRIEKLEGRQEE